MTARKKNPKVRGSWSITHGHSNPMSPTYNSWRGMIERCRPDKQYGKLGITVCDHWRTFANFLEDMGERPDGLEIDRKDPFGNYEPDNCQWLPKRPNRQHRRTTILTPELRAMIPRWRADGLSHRAIAARCGTGKTAIFKFLSGKSWAIPLPPKEFV
jgi:hypothetical protein